MVCHCSKLVVTCRYVSCLMAILNGKLLKLTINLGRHMKTIHLANLSFLSKALCCEFWGKILKLTINLERHMISLHLANLLFICKALSYDFCGKIFIVTINWEKHMKIIHLLSDFNSSSLYSALFTSSCLLTKLKEGFKKSKKCIVWLFYVTISAN